MLGANQLVGTDLTQAVPLTLARRRRRPDVRPRRVLVTTSIIIGSVPAVFVGSCPPERPRQVHPPGHHIRDRRLGPQVRRGGHDHTRLDTLRHPFRRGRRMAYICPPQPERSRTRRSGSHTRRPHNRAGARRLTCVWHARATATFQLEWVSRAGRRSRSCVCHSRRLHSHERRCDPRSVKGCALVRSRRDSCARADLDTPRAGRARLLPVEDRHCREQPRRSGAEGCRFVQQRQQRRRTDVSAVPRCRQDRATPLRSLERPCGDARQLAAWLYPNSRSRASHRRWVASRWAASSMPRAVLSS